MSVMSLKELPQQANGTKLSRIPAREQLTIMHARTLIFSASLSIVYCHASLAETGTAPSDGALGIYLENDLFGGTDRYYSNGAKISWSSRDLENLADSPYSELRAPVPPTRHWLQTFTALRRRDPGWVVKRTPACNVD
jgi:hypothetical protein